jgi:hypothetical protein
LGHQSALLETIALEWLFLVAPEYASASLVSDELQAAISNDRATVMLRKNFLFIILRLVIGYKNR